jgi:flagellar hook-associated protein 2
MSLSPLVFTGVSQFSSDFQTILDRAVRIAQIPVQVLQNRDADVLQQKTLLGGLAASVASLAASLEALGDTAASRALAASSSNASVVTVLNMGASSAAAYTIDSITSIAVAASERTLTGYADSAATPVSANGTMKLTVGSEEFVFTLTNNTLVGLRDKINALGAGVTASILTTADGNYLFVSVNATGATPLALHDDPGGANTSLLTATNPGSNAVFQLNGIAIEQSSNLVNSVIPGLTFTLLAESAAPVTLSLETDRSKLSAALQNFVSAYNHTRAQVSAQVGPAAGLLSGHVVVRQLQAELRNVASYRASEGEIRGLADLGISFDSAGKASFDSGALNGLAQSALEDAFSFLGSANQGLGGFSLKLRQYSDPISGLIRSEQNGLDRVDRALQAQMDALAARIDVMRRGLARKLQEADALLARLEAQQTTLKASLLGLNHVLYGRNDD